MTSRWTTGHVRFADFELDLSIGELRRDGEPVDIQPQPLEVLLHLAQRPGQLVHREELQRALWGDDAVVDIDRGLNHCIRKLRMTLGDSARTPRFVQTVPRRGYRLIAAATVPSDAVRASASESDAVGRPNSAATSAVGGVESTAIRLRIEPFRDLGVALATPQHFAAGVAEELISELVEARQRGLSLLDDAATAQPRQASEADYQLRAAIRRDDVRVRVNAHLARAVDGTVVDSAAFERPIDGDFELQRSLAIEISRRLVLPLLGGRQD